MSAGGRTTMADWAEDGEHPDEGTIHAWLDGALDADEAAKMETHIHSCAECTARVAAARGVIAGASRVVRMLDDIRAPLLRPASTPTVNATGSAWRLLRVTPARASIAAVLLVALGITFTHEKVAVDSSRELASIKSVEPVTPPVAMSPRIDAPSTNRVASRPALRMEDSVLRAAVARRIAIDQPQRVVEPAADVAMPTAPPPSLAKASETAASGSAGSQVAAGRAEQQRNEMMRGAKVDNVAAASAPPAEASAGCFRLESKAGTPADWRGVPLPLEIVLSRATGARGDRGEPRFAIQTPGEERAIGVWTRSAGDTLLLTMFGATATTSALLVPGGNPREGVAYVGMQSRTDAPAPALSTEKRAAPGVANAGGVQVVARRIPCVR